MNGSIVSQLSTINQVPQKSPLLGGEGQGDWPWPFPRQRRHSVRQPFDPGRRLIAAIACQAIIDLIEPSPKLTVSERRSAFTFLCQHRHTLLGLNIPANKLDFLADWLEQREEVAA